jgi:transposase
MEAQALASAKKNAKARGQTIVFIDETGLSERPHRVRTWAPRGHTPLLQMHFNWHKLSAVAGVTFWKLYFKIMPGSFNAARVIEFLQQLRRHIKRKLLVIWDGLPAHRSRAVRDYVDSTRGAIQIEQLPPYAPELNPVEYLWAHWKQHELANFCAKDFAELSQFARDKLRRSQRRPSIIAACWAQAELPI